MPLVRVDLVVLTVSDGHLQVLLSQRQESPFKGQWGLPGGVLRIDLDDSLDAAAHRVAHERLGRDVANLAQVVTVGGADRDPRAPWAMSVVYVTLVAPDLETYPGKRVQALGWRPIDQMKANGPLAFDHDGLVEHAVSWVQQSIRDMRYPRGSMAETFTLPELQAQSEAILGTALGKVTFRRRVEAAKLLEAVEGSMRGGSHRPAQVYRFASGSQGAPTC